MSREFRMLVECCCRAFAGAEGGERRELGKQADWPRFVRLARFHRVQGLVAKALTPPLASAPEETATAIKDDAAQIAARNLVAIAQCQRLLGAAKDAGVQLLFVKGLTLSVLAYGNATIKASVDVDLLVPDEQLHPVAAMLEDEGFTLVIPQGGLRRLAAWHRLSKESVWRNPESGVQLDLHTRLADNRRLIPSVGPWSPQQQVEVSAGLALPTLATDELFAYLCVHGASSAWFRLKWITDLAALVLRSGTSVEQLYRRSQDQGAGRAPAQALLLADMLYGTLEAAPELKRELAADRSNRRLAAMALAMLCGRDEPVEPTAAPFGTLPIHTSQLLLLPGIRFKLMEIWRQGRLSLAS